MEENTDKENTSGFSKTLWQRLVDIAAFIALPPAIAYAIGVVALWLQLSAVYNGFSTDAWITWQAAMMASKPLAAGMGIRALLATVALSLLTTALAMFIYQIYVRASTERIQALSVFPPLICLVIGMGLILPSGVLEGVSSRISSSPNSESYTPIVSQLRTLVMPMSVLLLYILWGFLSGVLRLPTIRRALGYYPRKLYAAILPIALLFLLVSFLFPGQLQLPCLVKQLSAGDVLNGEVLTAPEAKELDGTVAQGRLVAHTEGQWWIFDSEGRFTSISDNQSRMQIEAPFGSLPTRGESNYSGPVSEAPYNPIQQCT